LEKGNLSEQKKILAGKNSLSKKVFSLSKKGYPNFYRGTFLEFILIKIVRRLVDLKNKIK
jgi:hypothetical protein